MFNLTGSAIEHLTTCQVHHPATGAVCGQRIKAPALDVPIIGEPPSMKAQRLVGGLFKHLEKAHPEMASQVAIGAMMLQGFMILRCFQTQDPGLLTAEENARAAIAQITRKNLMTDQNITESLVKIGYDEAQIATIGPVIQQMRDFLIESGAYSPQARQQQQDGPPQAPPE